MYDTNNIRQLQQDDAHEPEDWNYDVAYGLRVDRPQRTESEVIPPELIQSEVTVNGAALAAVGKNSRQNSDDGWGELNETTGQRRNHRNNHLSISNSNRAPATFDESAYMAEND